MIHYSKVIGCPYCAAGDEPVLVPLKDGSSIINAYHEVPGDHPDDPYDTIRPGCSDYSRHRRLYEKERMRPATPATTQRYVGAAVNPRLRGGHCFAAAEEGGMNDELTTAVAQLRHAYHNLIAPDAALWDSHDRRQFADGLIAPQIVRLERFMADRPVEHADNCDTLTANPPECTCGAVAIASLPKKEQP
jgi:hypothetical protein